MRQNADDDAATIHAATFYAFRVSEPIIHADGDDPPVRVAFLAATGRSGSTLVSRVMGSLPQTCSVGELSWIWTYGLRLNRPCGCGNAFEDCPFWVSVGQRAFGGWHQVDVEEAILLRRSLTLNRRIPELFTRPTPRTARLLDRYTRLLAPLYRAIRDESGADVVIDNSKQVGMALITRRTPGVKLDLVHLVRRSHGVAYSWSKHVARSDNPGKEMRRRGPSRTALRWTADNLLFEGMQATGSRAITVRYEDMVAAPRETIRALATFLGIDLKAVDGILPTEREVSIATDHSVWGNPMRMSTGPVSLVLDEAWRQEMPTRDRIEVTALSWPALIRFGYFSR